MKSEVSTIDPQPTATADLKTARAEYLGTLLDLRSPSPDLADFQPIRDRAEAIVRSSSVPSQREEEWRFTDLSALLQITFAAGNPPLGIGFEQLEPFLLPDVKTRLVFVDGVFAADLSTVDDLPDGVLVGNLATAAQLLPLTKDYLGKQSGADETFTALNTANLTDAAIVYVPKNQSVDPIHLLFVSTRDENPVVSHPRALVIAQTGSSVTIVEDYVTLNEGVYFTNPVTEIWVEDNAEVRHTRIQRDSDQAFHIGKTAVSQARDSRYSCTAISLGAKVSRHHLEVYQTGEQTDTVMNGLTVVDGDRLGDVHSLLSLSKPYGTSHQINKTIVSDRAHAVFNGKVFVPRAAQQTDAGQLSRNLLLSPRARVDTKPQLEIVADNVKCSHGATVSQLEDDEVFYLQSRGIAAADARKLLTYAFAIEVIDQIPVASLRNRLADRIRTQTTPT